MATNKTCNRKDRKGSAKVAKKDFRLRTRSFLNCALIFFAYFALFSATFALKSFCCLLSIIKIAGHEFRQRRRVHSQTMFSRVGINANTSAAILSIGSVNCVQFGQPP